MEGEKEEWGREREREMEVGGREDAEIRMYHCMCVIRAIKG